MLGGIVIAAIYNGIYLLGISAAAQDLIFALVLLAAVSADVLARRGPGQPTGLTGGGGRVGFLSARVRATASGDHAGGSHRGR